jgi:hypothetical protein
MEKKRTKGKCKSNKTERILITQPYSTDTKRTLIGYKPTIPLPRYSAQKQLGSWDPRS